MWNSDNPIFNVNGDTLKKLKETINLALDGRKIGGYIFKKEKGLILLSYISSSNKDVIKFPAPLNSDQIADIVFEWLKTEEALLVPNEGWDADADHDGNNELGWRVYTENWGKIAGYSNALAIKPAYLWYGK